MGASGPEGGDGLAEGGIVAEGVGVDVAGVGDFAAGSGGGAVDFGVGQGFQCLVVGCCVSADGWRRGR